MESGKCAGYRLLNIDRLLDEIDAGINSRNLSNTEILEVQRLSRPAKKILVV